LGEEQKRFGEKGRTAGGKMAAPMSSTQLFGARLLMEIGSEEGSLEDVRATLFLVVVKLWQGSVLIDKPLPPIHSHPLPSSSSFQLINLSYVKILKELCTLSIPHPSRTGISELDNLWRQHGFTSKLNITGRGLPLLYHLLTHLLSLNNTISLIDLDGRFSPSHIHLPPSLLNHIHVFRPTTSNLKVTLESIERYMLYGEHGSKGREWFGTVVIGGTGGDVNVGWRGWLTVEREEGGGFGWGVSVEEAVGDRERRREIMDGKGWRGFNEELGGKVRFK
jgi:hypothetical protein